MDLKKKRLRQHDLKKSSAEVAAQFAVAEF
jgi:hypothetical protein